MGAEEDEELQTALADEDGWEDVAEEDLAEMEAFLAELKAENPDINFDEVDIVMNEDGEIEVHERVRVQRSQTQIVKDAGGLSSYNKKKKLRNIKANKGPAKAQRAIYNRRTKNRKPKFT